MSPVPAAIRHLREATVSLGIPLRLDAFLLSDRRDCALAVAFARFLGFSPAVFPTHGSSADQSFDELAIIFRPSGVAILGSCFDVLNTRGLQLASSSNVFNSSKTVAAGVSPSAFLSAVISSAPAHSRTLDAGSLFADHVPSIVRTSVPRRAVR